LLLILFKLLDILILNIDSSTRILEVRNEKLKIE